MLVSSLQNIYFPSQSVSDGRILLFLLQTFDPFNLFLFLFYGSIGLLDIICRLSQKKKKY